jgi:hypothetical protein
MIHPGRLSPPSALVPIGHHRFDAVDVRAEAAELHLLTLARLDGERIGIHPLVCGHVRRLVRIRQYVEDRWFLYDREKGHSGHDLLQYVPNFCLDFGLGLRRWSGNEMSTVRKLPPIQGAEHSRLARIGSRLLKVDVEHPPLKRSSRVLRDDGEHQLRH